MDTFLSTKIVLVGLMESFLKGVQRRKPQRKHLTKIAKRKQANFLVWTKLLKLRSIRNVSTVNTLVQVLNVERVANFIIFHVLQPPDLFCTNLPLHLWGQKAYPKSQVRKNVKGFPDFRGFLKVLEVFFHENVTLINHNSIQLSYMNDAFSELVF